MKKFKVLKNFTHGSRIIEAGSEFETRDPKLIASLLKYELVEEISAGTPPPPPAPGSTEQPK